MIEKLVQETVDEPKATEKVEKITFSVGMEVLCPSRFGNEVMVVDKVFPVPAGEQRLVMHHQWVILRHQNGPVESSLSGYYLTLANI